VVSTPLKNISQIGSSSQLLGKIKNVPNHQPVVILLLLIWENDPEKVNIGDLTSCYMGKLH
jgi:hypothetical protein